MRVFLDLGSKFGWASVTNFNVRMSASVDMRPRKHENWSARFHKFRDVLNQLHGAEPVTDIWYEEVRRHEGTDAAHIYGGFIANLGQWAEEHGAAITGVPVGTIKKFATGRGNASKSEMLLACSEKFGVIPSDDNEADAVALRELVLAGGLK